MSDISERIVKAIETNFDECVKEAAHAEWMRLSGKFDQPTEFERHIKLLVEMRTRQLAAAGKALVA